MRLLYLNHNVVGSGTYFRAFHFGTQLAARGHQVTLVTTSRDSRFKPSTYPRNGVEVIEAPDLMPGRARTGWDPYNTLVRRSIVRRRAFDVVHAFDSRPAVIHPALAAVAANDALFIMDWADWWGRGGWQTERSGPLFRATFGPIETWYEEAFRTRAHGMTVISRALGERSASLGVASERIACIPFGSVVEERVSRARARKELGISANARIVLHTGVITRGDYEFLKSACEQVGDCKLVLAGRTGSVIAESANVQVTGPLDDETMRLWLGASNVCVVPLRDTLGNRGRWPSKINTYLAHGRAVVLPRVGDAADFIAQARAGVVTQATVEAFGNGIAAMLADSDAADEAGERGRIAADAELAWPKLTDRLETFYQQVAAL